jgi:hypothetical protein
VSFLRHQQDRDGGFPSEPGGGSNAQSTAWAIQGLVASGVSPAGFRVAGGSTAIAYLLSLAGPNGSIRYARGVGQTPVWVTGEALMALEGKPLPVAPPAAPAAGAGASPPRSVHAARRVRAARHPARRARPRASAHTTVPSRPLARSAASAPRIPVSAGGLAGAVGVMTALVLAPVGLG